MLRESSYVVKKHRFHSLVRGIKDLHHLHTSTASVILTNSFPVAVSIPWESWNLKEGLRVTPAPGHREVLTWPTLTRTPRTTRGLHCITIEGQTLTVLQFSSVTQSCPTLCDPMNRSMPGLPVHHQLLEFSQTHVHRVSDAIQPSHILSSPSPPAPNPSQHQVLRVV